MDIIDESDDIDTNEKENSQDGALKEKSECTIFFKYPKQFLF